MSASVAYETATLPDPESLVREHATLVRRIALHLVGRLPASVDVDDLVQSGMIGLLEAARAFDPGQGASFESFAGYRIRGAMLDELRRGDWAPRSVHRQARELRRTVDELRQKMGRQPTLQEIAEATGMPAGDCLRILDDAARCCLLSLDLGQDDGEGGAALPAAAGNGPEAQLQGRQRAERLAEAIRQLPERDQLVLSLYYRDELHQKEIGHVLGVSESRVCQLHSRALQALRKRLDDL